jgi:hypothetical protein
MLGKFLYLDNCIISNVSYLIHAIGKIAVTRILSSGCVGALRSKDLRSIIFDFLKVVYKNFRGCVDLSSEILTP